jgi:hypothetical protein
MFLDTLLNTHLEYHPLSAVQNYLRGIFELLSVYGEVYSVNKVRKYRLFLPAL